VISGLPGSSSSRAFGDQNGRGVLRPTAIRTLGIPPSVRAGYLLLRGSFPLGTEAIMADPATARALLFLLELHYCSIQLTSQRLCDELLLSWDILHWILLQKLRS
jgi:hypothetical protein